MAKKGKNCYPERVLHEHRLQPEIDNRILKSLPVSEELKQRLREKKAGINVLKLQRDLDAALENPCRFVHYSPGAPDCPKAWSSFTLKFHKPFDQIFT